MHGCIIYSFVSMVKLVGSSCPRLLRTEKVEKYNTLNKRRRQDEACSSLQRVLHVGAPSVKVELLVENY